MPKQKQKAKKSEPKLEVRDTKNAEKQSTKKVQKKGK